MHSFARVWQTLCIGLCLVPCSLLAQQVPTDPASTHIFPAGGRRGTKVQVRVGGECLPPQARFRILGDGLKSSEVLGPRAEFRGEPSPRRKPGESHINYPKEWTSEIEIAADAPLGARSWWLACARGGTGARSFLVGDLPEFIEAESNSLPERAESIALPVTVNGQIDGERDMDFFRFAADAGQVVVADVMAARLGSPLEAVVEFRDAAGKRLPVQECRVGSDPVVALRVPARGEYQLLVANLGLPGGPQFVYRISLSTLPYPRLAFPAGGMAGETRRLDLLTLTGTPQWKVVSQDAALLAEPVGDWWQPAGMYPRLPLDVGTYPEYIEQGDNDTLATAAAVSSPVTLNGRLETARDEDRFRFDARQGEPLSIECRPAGDGLPILPILSVHDAAGGTLASASAVDTPDRRPCLEAWTPPATGTYLLKICDVQQGVAGGEEFVYRVAIQPARGGFELTLKSDAANHLPGSRTEVDVFVRRRGGFDGPVQVAAEGLPAGVRAEPLEIPAGAPSGKLVFVSDASSPPTPDDKLVQITGTAEIAGAKVSRLAVMPHLSRDAEGVSVGPAAADRFHLTVQSKPPFRLFCSEAYQYAHRGTIHRYQMEVERMGYDGPITLQLADRQIKDLDGIEIPEVTIPAGESRIMLPLYLPESMHINVQAHSNVYAQGIARFQDSLGREQTSCIVSEMRCMIRTLPTVTRLVAIDRAVRLRAGTAITCRLHLDRTPLFDGPVTVSLAEPALAAAAGLSAAHVQIPAGRSEATIEIRAQGDAKPASSTWLRLRGTGELANGTVVVSETRVQVGVD
jgi:hypothetical protein